MVEIYDFPDGRLEVRWKGRPLPYSAFDKLQRVSHAAIVENKRLGEILAWIKEQQDSRESAYAPISSTSACGKKPDGYAFHYWSASANACAPATESNCSKYEIVRCRPSVSITVGRQSSKSCA